MRLSQKGIALLTAYEGFEGEAYQDIAGVWTIGYGHTHGFKDGTFNAGSRLTQKAAIELLTNHDLPKFEVPVLDIVERNCTQNEFDAMVILAYNIGVAGFRRSSVARLHNAGAPADEVAQKFLLWNKATVNGVKRPVTGLTRRRADEGEVYAYAEYAQDRDGVITPTRRQFAEAYS